MGDEPMNIIIIIIIIIMIVLILFAEKYFCSSKKLK